MKATVKIKTQTLEITKFVKWENEHQKYEGVAYMTSKKGVQYMAFIRKDNGKADVSYVSGFSTRSIGQCEVYGLEFQPYPEQAALIEKAVAEKFGIGSNVEIMEKGIKLNVQTWQSATTLLREFRRHRAIVMANDNLNFTIFIPITPHNLLTKG